MSLFGKIGTTHYNMNNLTMLSKEELKRYNRHIILPEFGKEGQVKLKNSRVLVVGAGGLGCPVLLYLTAAGVGTIGIIDDDKVDESNLQRQVLFDSNDVGYLKAEAAVQKLTVQNPNIGFEVCTERLTSENAIALISNYDLVVDGSDNFQTRYLVNDACVLTNKPFVFGSIFKFDGQVSVFNYNNGPTYRCLFPEPPSAGEVPSCSQVGVIGVLPGIIGTLQATEAIKVLTGIGEPLVGKLFHFDALTMQSTVFQFEKNTEIVVTELIDYDVFCGVEKVAISEEVASITSSELSILMGIKPVCLLDVREDFELDICKIGDAQHIPLAEVSGRVAEINRDEQVVVYCHHGMRSAIAIKLLKQEYGFTNLVNLEGGIHAWAEEVDDEMERY